MTMADDGAERPEPPPERGNEESWYFDLPSGAWERQEQKNRDLRKVILSNMEDSKKEAFAPSKKGGIFGGRSKDREPKVSDREMRRASLQAESQPTQAQPDSTRATPSEGSLARHPVEEDQWSTESFEMGTAETEPPAPLHRRFAADRDEGFESTEAVSTPDPEDSRYVPDGEAPKSRWDEVFSAPAGEGSLIDGLRGWAKTSEETESARPPTRRRFFEAPNVDTGDDEEVEASPEERDSRPIPLFRRQQPAPSPAEETNGPQAPASRWDEVMSAPAGDFGLLEGMKQWTAKADEEPPRRRRLLDPIDEDDTSSGEPWDGPKHLSLDSNDHTAPASPRSGPVERLAALNLGAETDDSDDIFGLNRHLKTPVSHTPAHEPEKKKRGGLGRLFGKKRDDSEPPVVPPSALSGAWLPDDMPEAVQPIAPQFTDSKWDTDSSDWDIESPISPALPTEEVAAVTDDDDWGTPTDDGPTENTPDVQPRWSWLTADSKAAAEQTGDAVAKVESETDHAGWDAWESSAQTEVLAEPVAFDARLSAVSATVEPVEVNEPGWEPEPAARTARDAETPWAAWNTSPTANDVASQAIPHIETATSIDEATASTWQPSEEDTSWEPDVTAETELEVVHESTAATEALLTLAEPVGESNANPLAEIPEAPIAVYEASELGTSEAAVVPDSPATDSPETQPSAEPIFAHDHTPDSEAPAATWWAPTIAPYVAEPAAQSRDEDLWANVAALDIEELTATPVVAARSDAPSADDDPWADFLSLPSTEPVIHQLPGTEPVPSSPPASNTWDEAFNVLAQGEPEPDPFEDSFTPLEESEDPWGALSAAPTVGEAPPSIALTPREDGTRFELLYEQAGLGAEPEPEQAFIAPESIEETVAATSSDSLHERPGTPDNAYWIDDGEPDADDVVLRAFEAHAATPDDDRHAVHHQPTAPKAEPEEHVFEELLGEEGDELIEEASAASVDFRSFGRQQGWAPQRSAVEQAASSLNSATAPRPWEKPFDAPAPSPSFGDRDEYAAEGSTTDSGSKTRTLIRELVETGLLALLVFLSVRASFQNFKVDGSSMFPTLEDGQFLIVNKLVYAEVDVEKLSNFVPFVDPGETPQRYVFHGPQRGDIVVLKDPRVPDQDLIKRVVGLPGESIEIKEGRVYINDFLLEEPYIKSEWHDNKGKVLIPQGEYFVMGDNRDNSKDSRSSQVGFVPKDLLIGKATLSYWPKSKFGLAPNEPGSAQGPRLSTTRITDTNRVQGGDATTSPATVAAAP